ncbi:MAG: hypothetical protein AVDCRST_MAG11-1207, partial [uncultured Gemmatimonadaceae bacterium]
MHTTNSRRGSTATLLGVLLATAACAAPAGT